MTALSPLCITAAAHAVSFVFILLVESTCESLCLTGHSHCSLQLCALPEVQQTDAQTGACPLKYLELIGGGSSLLLKYDYYNHFDRKLQCLEHTCNPGTRKPEEGRPQLLG